jgi:RNA-directed DNA polymerase
METYFTFDNLYKAYLACRKRKIKTLNHLRFFENLEENLLELEKELRDRTYRPGQSIVFIVDKPKVREIFAASFRDRVVHHLLYNYLSPKFERIFIYDSWACRKDKGTHRAVIRLQDFTFKAQRLDADEQFYLKMDIKSYFTTIDQSILYDMIARKIKRDEILWLTKVIVFHDCARDISPKVQGRQALFDKLPKDKSLFTVPRGKGLPIGNLTSQFFANIYLNELD